MVISFPVVPLESWNLCGEPAAGTGMCAFHVDLSPNLPDHEYDQTTGRPRALTAMLEQNPALFASLTNTAATATFGQGSHNRFIDINAQLTV
ncbi:hypothetical protein [Tsuneonella suprasediminis]|uniref:hypothetical protein n=1 Tax=Tsuneonella suprasediminis TaxID=2306996 RepID=UPI002F959083